MASTLGLQSRHRPTRFQRPVSPASDESDYHEPVPVVWPPLPTRRQTSSSWKANKAQDTSNNSRPTSNQRSRKPSADSPKQPENRHVQQPNPDSDVQKTNPDQNDPNPHRRNPRRKDRRDRKSSAVKHENAQRSENASKDRRRSNCRGPPDAVYVIPRNIADQIIAQGGIRLCSALSETDDYPAVNNDSACFTGQSRRLGSSSPVETRDSNSQFRDARQSDLFGRSRDSSLENQSVKHLKHSRNLPRNPRNVAPFTAGFNSDNEYSDIEDSSRGLASLRVNKNRRDNKTIKINGMSTVKTPQLMYKSQYGPEQDDTWSISPNSTVSNLEADDDGYKVVLTERDVRRIAPGSPSKEDSKYERDIQAALHASMKHDGAIQNTLATPGCGSGSSRKRRPSMRPQRRLATPWMTPHGNHAAVPGTTCHLLDSCPLEIRDQIYEYMIGDGAFVEMSTLPLFKRKKSKYKIVTISGQTNHRSGVSFSIDRSILITDPESVRVEWIRNLSGCNPKGNLDFHTEKHRLSNIGLLRACKQTSAEYSRALYRSTVFGFGTSKAIQKFLSSSEGDLQTRAMSKLVQNMLPLASFAYNKGNIQYLHLNIEPYNEPETMKWRVWKSRYYDSWTQACLRFIRETNIKHLDLCMTLPDDSPKQLTLEEMWAKPILAFCETNLSSCHIKLKSYESDGVNAHTLEAFAEVLHRRLKGFDRSAALDAIQQIQQEKHSADAKTKDTRRDWRLVAQWNKLTPHDDLLDSSYHRNGNRRT